MQRTQKTLTMFERICHVEERATAPRPICVPHIGASAVGFFSHRRPRGSLYDTIEPCDPSSSGVMIAALAMCWRYFAPQIRSRLSCLWTPCVLHERATRVFCLICFPFPCSRGGIYDFGENPVDLLKLLRMLSKYTAQIVQAGSSY